MKTIILLFAIIMIILLPCFANAGKSFALINVTVIDVRVGIALSEMTVRINKIYKAFFTLIFFSLGFMLTASAQNSDNSFIEKEVTIKTSASNIELAGTLSLPNSKAPFPAILLITSAGGQNRNQVVSGVPMFQIIAQQLVKNGFAVLRVDDRGIGGSKGSSVWDSTTAEKALDMEDCVKFLKTIPEIDAKRIGLVGHSEGAIVAPMVALKMAEINFVVLLGSPGVSGEEIMNRQQNEEAKKRTKNETVLKAVQAQRRKMIDFIKNGKNDDETFYQIGHDYFVAFGMPESSINRELISQNFGFWRKKWFSFFFANNPSQNLKKLQIPTLIVAGSADEQVSLEQNLNNLVSALIEGGNQEFTAVVLPKQNHFFLISEDVSNPEKPALSPSLLEVMTSWIKMKSK